MDSIPLKTLLEPLAADLEKAREVITRAGKIIEEHFDETHVSFGIDYQGYASNSKYWVQRSHDSGASRWVDTLDEAVVFLEEFNPQKAKQAKIDKLRAELAALEGSVAATAEEKAIKAGEAVVG